MDNNSLNLLLSSDSNPIIVDDKKIESYQTNELDADSCTNSSTDELLTRRSSCGSYCSSSSNADENDNNSIILASKYLYDETVADESSDDRHSSFCASETQHQTEALPQQQQQQEQESEKTCQQMHQQVDDIFPHPPSRIIQQNPTLAASPVPYTSSLFGSARKFGASNEFSPTQNSEVLTQNQDLTQFFDDIGENSNLLSPLPPNSPRALRRIPWGRLLPCSTSQSRTDLLPRDPSSAPANASSTGTKGVSLFGLDNIHPSDIFNEYTIGRSKNCDVSICKPPCTVSISKNQKARQEWAYGLISNRHCRIYCSLRSGADTLVGGVNVDVYIEDCSGNGTIVNKTTILRKGEKRILHSGDEICLVYARTLREKFSSNLDDILQQFSFVFVNCNNDVMISTPPNPRSFINSISGLKDPGFPESSQTKKRKAAVDVRSTKHPRVHQYANNQDTIDNEACRVFGSQRSCNKNSQETVNNNENCESIQKASGQQNISPLRRIQEDYDIRDLLGSGTVGNVHRAIHRKSGQERAIKIIQLSRNRANFAAMNKNNTFTAAAAAEQFQVEAKILQGLEHPYIVKLIDVYVTPGVAVFLVMELVSGGDLFDRIVEKGRYSEIESRRVMRRLLSAIYYLHEERNIVHRDLKPENILCISHKNDVEVKITDFGLAKSVSGNEDGLKTFCGTPQYFAPEVLKRRHTIAGCGRYGKQADMWSVGVILYVLLSGTPPFDAGVDTVAYVNQIEFPDEFWHGVSADAKDLVLKLLVKDPKQRFTVKDACEHKWILTSDGDTHIHPLDDPQFLQPKTRAPGKASKESILIENESIEKQSTQKPLLLSNCTEMKNESDSTICNCMLNEGATKGDQITLIRSPDVEMKCAIDKPLDNQLDLTIPLNCSTNSDEPSSENIANDNRTVQVVGGHTKTVRINDFRRPLSPVLMNETGLCVNVSRSDDISKLGNSTPVKSETSAKPETSLKSEILLRSSLKNDSNRNWGRPRFNSSAAAVTPGVSNKSAINPPDEMIVKRQLLSSLELSDDEVFSQFSEQTESISSFSTAIPLVHCSDGEEEARSTHQTSSRLEESAPSTSASAQPMRKKSGKVIVDPSSFNNGKKSREPKKGVNSNKSVTVQKTKTQQRVPKQPTAANAKVKKSFNGPEERERRNVNPTTGGKQTTLSSWFKSH